MIPRILSLICTLLFLLLISGCWDQRPIVKKVLVNGVSFDIDKEDKIELNALILDIVGKGIGMYDLESKFVSAKQDSVYESGIKLQSLLPGDIETSKTRIFLLGEEFSKQKIQALLDSFNRSTFSNLNAYVAITNKQPAKDVLKLKTLDKKPVSFILTETLKTAVDNSIVAKLDLQEVFKLSSDDGIDFMLPVLDTTKENQIEVIGAGLFHKGRYSGHMVKLDHSPILLMMMDNYGKRGLFATKVPENTNQEKPFNNISYQVIHPSRKFSVSSYTNEIGVNIDLNTKVVINEVTSKKFMTNKELEKIIQEDLNTKAKEVVKEICQANSDVLGIGRYLKEHEPKTWKKLDWDKEYPNIQIRTKVTVHLVSSGVIKEN